MTSSQGRALTGIRGWLILPALILIWAPIGFVRLNVLPLLRNDYPLGYTINYPVLAADVVVLLIIAMVAWFFFRRKRVAPPLFIIEILLVTAVWNVLEGLIQSQHPAPVSSMIFSCLVVIPYFSLSKRVENTFVQSLDQRLAVDRVFAHAAAPLEGFFAAVKKTRRWIVLWCLLYLVGMTLVNCALRSLRIDGTVANALDYL